ncbi:MAG TPA: CapA family protein [Candidatus Enterocloster faecavium]|uniref:CapA family protein n=1 Tax=Candidatus Enterocloster faecavium TaxID=2838560 RepID=A0A9D2RKQ8_9FIRM|nr:CapA family protein [Candidatus Enterocloster faecavium]
MKGKGTVAAAAALLGILLIAVLGLLIGKGVYGSYEKVETMAVSEGEKKGEKASLPEETEQMAVQTEPSAVYQEETSAGWPEPEEAVTLLFAGDVLLSDHVLNAYQSGGGITGVVDQNLLEEIQKADLFMVNEEFPFSTRGEAAPDKQYTFRLPPERVSIFQEMGIDLVTLANNHALDFGTDALVDTLDTLDGAGISHVGAGRNLEEAKKPVIVELQGKTIGFLGASRVIPETSWNASSSKPGMLVTYDPSMTIQEIEKLDQNCDYVVVYVHWGIERAEHPEEYQRAMGKQYIDAGADLVVGSHPHVLQGIEYYKGKPIIYSLGNFVFGSSIPRTALLKAELGSGQEKLTLIPGTSGAGYTRALTEDGEKEEFYSYITGISYGVTIDEQGEVQPVSQY